MLHSKPQLCGLPAGSSTPSTFNTNAPIPPQASHKAESRSAISGQRAAGGDVLHGYAPSMWPPRWLFFCMVSPAECRWLRARSRWRGSRDSWAGDSQLPLREPNGRQEPPNPSPKRPNARQKYTPWRQTVTIRTPWARSAARIGRLRALAPQMHR